MGAVLKTVGEPLALSDRAEISSGLNMSTVLLQGTNAMYQLAFAA